MKTRIAIGLGVLLAICACGERPRRDTSAQAPQVVEDQARRFPLRGVVRQVDPDRSEVTVEHEEIPGYMGAMTMVFSVPDESSLTEIEAGARVEATLVVEGARYWLEGLRPTTLLATPVVNVVTPVPNRGVPVGQTVPDFALTDQTGHTVRLSQMRGAPVAVTFIYTRCPVATACPLTTAKFSKLDAMLREKPVGSLLVITVEPDYDTPEVLADYAKKAGVDPKRWKFLTGSPKAVADVATSFGVVYYPEKGQIIHSQAVAVVDPEGRLSTIYYGETWEPEHLLRDMEKASKG